MKTSTNKDEVQVQLIRRGGGEWEEGRVIGRRQRPRSRYIYVRRARYNKKREPVARATRNLPPRSLPQQIHPPAVPPPPTSPSPPPPPLPSLPPTLPLPTRSTRRILPSKAARTHFTRCCIADVRTTHGTIHYSVLLYETYADQTRQGSRTENSVNTPNGTVARRCVRGRTLARDELRRYAFMFTYIVYRERERDKKRDMSVYRVEKKKKHTRSLSLTKVQEGGCGFL